MTRFDRMDKNQHAHQPLTSQDIFRRFIESIRPKVIGMQIGKSFTRVLNSYLQILQIKFYELKELYHA